MREKGRRWPDATQDHSQEKGSIPEALYSAVELEGLLQQLLKRLHLEISKNSPTGHCEWFGHRAKSGNLFQGVLKRFKWRPCGVLSSLLTAPAPPPWQRKSPVPAASESKAHPAPESAEPPSGPW